MTTIEDRFWAKVQKTDTCWLWTAGKNNGGYGYFEGQGAHRWLYKRTAGTVLGRWDFLCHRCDTPACVRPDHLFVGTPLDNQRDMSDKGRAWKPKGEAHPMHRLSAGDIPLIRQRRGEPSPVVARDFHVAARTIRDIWNERTWTHV